MNNPNLPLLAVTVRLLEPLLGDLVFAGGCATGLLMSDPAAEGVRPATDVGAITEVTSYSQYASLSERLRALKGIEIAPYHTLGDLPTPEVTHRFC